MTQAEDTLLDAIYEDDLDKVAAMLKAQPDLATDLDELCAAVHWGTPSALALMIQHGAPMVIEVDDGFPLLHIAIDRASEPAPGQTGGGHDVLRFLLQNGADVNERGMNDWTPLHRAAAFGDSRSCQILLDHGADRTLTTRIDNYGTAEDEARSYGHHATADLIRDYSPAP